MEKVKLKEVARAARVHIGTASKILNRRTKEKFNEHTQQRVFKTAARLGYLHPALSKSKPVRAPRINLNARAVIKIRLWNGALFSQCRAQVVNISSTGMLLKSFTWGQKGHIPWAISQRLCDVQDVVVHVRPEDSVSEGEI
jgi:hypothetical protein